ncbi:hypothetical protein EAL2_c17580 [Peptoclostridium acidaminophilum DSM 3953]|uniref:Uncharacterized protein n=1 Tax=Peptoclostridium acidaminophilum DSM 3953 TaxID=1286171 RepID=W8TGT9_PEPAC|nr:hypothetical protein EAL2_c17580 [Peptoclostridium acidaminophilum DSM 3953]
MPIINVTDVQSFFLSTNPNTFIPQMLAFKPFLIKNKRLPYGQPL